MTSPQDPAPTPLAIASVVEIQALERQVIEEWAYPALLLMERAALNVVAFLDRHFPQAPVLVMAGTGNNAADALATARLLVDRGRTVRVLTVGASLGEGASRQMNWLARRGLAPKTFAGSEAFGPEWVVLDGLFGVGLNRPVRSDAQLAIDWINARPWRSVVAIDVPSGLDAETGRVLGACVKANFTVALGALKPGLLADPALACIGQLWLADIGFPPALLQALPGRLNRPSPLPEAGLAAHKYSLGTVMVIAGSASMSGAAVLATRAAARSGAGLVYLAIARGQRDMAALAVPEAIVIGLNERDGSVTADAIAVLEPHFARLSAIAIGPGLGHTPEVTALVRAVLEGYAGPVVLDADALPRHGEPWQVREHPTLMTPHTGEMARMLGMSAEDVGNDRLNCARRVAEAFGVTCVLKGARSVIAAPDGRYALNATGNPLLATGGSGDVLTGLAAGLLARGLLPYEAACTAVYTHGRTAEAAAEAGMVSLVAGDIIERLPHVLGRPPLPRLRIGDTRLIQ